MNSNEPMSGESKSDGALVCSDGLSGILCRNCHRPIQNEREYWLHSDGRNYDHEALPDPATMPMPEAALKDAWNNICEFWDKLSEYRQRVRELEIWKEATEIELSKANSELAKWQSGIKRYAA